MNRRVGWISRLFRRKSCAAKGESKRMNRVKKFRGCLLGGAAGDALGYAVEFVLEPRIDERYGADGIRRYELINGVAIVSDDTQMTMYTANGLLCGEAAGGSEADYYRGIAACYLDWLKTQDGPEYEPSDGTVSWLNSLREMNSCRAPGGTCLGALSGGKFGTTAEPINGSKGCGGVMRTAPVGLFFEDEDLCCRLGAEAAAITHGHDLGYLPAAALSCIVSRAVYGERIPLEEAVLSSEAALARNFPDAPHLGVMISLLDRARELSKKDMKDQDAIHQLGQGWVGEEALGIAVYCALRYPDDFEKCITAAANHNGDSDSTAAIAGNILGAYLGEDCIAPHYLEKLELKDALVKLADDMYSAVCERCGTKASDWKREYSRL